MTEVLIPYMRQSRKKEQTISIDEQRRSIQTWATQAGVKLGVEIVEQDVSGSKSWRERGIGRAVEACEQGSASGIIVAFQDRLSRENGLATAEVWQSLESASARLVAVGDGIDTDSGDQEMLFTIKAAIARDQWKRHRANWENAQRNATERGVLVGLTPVGYVKDQNGQLILDPETSETIREVFQLRAIGTSWNEICKMLDATGIKTARGGNIWTHRTVSKIVENEVYLGVLKRGEYRKEGNHIPLIDRATWTAAQSKHQSERSSRVKCGDGEGTRLAGLIFCGSCGRRMTPEKRSDETKARYRCRSRIVANGDHCEHPTTVRISDTDAFVVEQFIDHYDSLHFTDETEAPETTYLRRRLQKATDARDALLEDLESLAALPSEVRAATLTKAQSKVDAIQRDIDEIESAHVKSVFNVWNVGAYFEPEAWKEASISDQRRLLAAGIEKIIVSPGRAPVAQRVAVEFPEQAQAEVIDLDTARQAVA